MKYEHRQYQADATSRMVEFLLAQARAKKPRNGIVYVPTGGGKSKILGDASVELVRHAQGAPVIVTQPSVEILEQNKAKIEEYGFRCGVMSAAMGRRDMGDVTLCTIGTIFRHPEWFDGFGFGIADECHMVNAKDNSKVVVAGEDNEFYHKEHGLVRELKNQQSIPKGKVLVMTEEGKEQIIPRPKKSMYKSFMEEVPHMRWCGLTASPYRRHSDQWGTQLHMLTRTRPTLFHEFVHYTQNRELFDAGYLAKLRYRIVEGFKPSLIAPNSIGAEYDEKALQMHLWELNWQTKAGTKVDFKDKLTEVAEGVLSCGRKRVIVFTSTIAESERLAQNLGGECAVITGDTDKDWRRDTVADFKAGRLPVLSNVGVFIHGLDVPEIDCVIDAAPTMSLARWYQKLGRGVRKADGKEDCWIIDMVEGVRTFGKIEDLTLYCDGERKWNVYGRPGGGAEKCLTHIYLSGGVRGLCPKCRKPKVMAWYEKTKKWLPLSAREHGNVIIKETETKKKVCEFVKRGEGTHVFHSIICKKESS